MFRENWCESLWRVANVRILFIVLCFLWFRWTSRFTDFILDWYRFCDNAFDRCWRMSNFRFWFVLHCFFLLLGSWTGQTEAYYLFYSCFIYVSWKLMWEFVQGFQCSNLVYFMMCFWWFRILFILYLFLYMFCGGIRALTGRAPGGHRARTRFERWTSTAL